MQHRLSFISNNATTSLDEEWSTQIDAILKSTVSLELPTLFDFDEEPFHILTEHAARYIIKRYDDGCYVVFHKNDRYYLLAKVGSEVRQYDIVAKIADTHTPPSTFPFFASKSRLFNLRDDKGELVFCGVSASSLNGFFNFFKIQEFFPNQLKLGRVKLLVSSATDSLTTLTLKRLIIDKPNLSWLPFLPADLQEQALYYFLGTFIGIRVVENLQFFLRYTLLSDHPWELDWQKYYSMEEISHNINCLRVLYRNGNTRAAELLAAIVYDGIGEPYDRKLDFYVSQLYRPLVPVKKRKVLFRDLNEYLEITQNAVLFPDKIVRDFFLLKFYKARRDQKMFQDLLRQMDVSQAIRLAMFDDSHIYSYIKVQGIEPLMNVKYVLHELIALGRAPLANWIKEMLPEKVLQEKTEDDQNILHTLVDYLSKHEICGSRPILEIFKFVSNLYPKMFAEADSNGRTVYDAIEVLTQTCDIEIRDELQACVELSRAYERSMVI